MHQTTIVPQKNQHPVTQADIEKGKISDRVARNQVNLDSEFRAISELSSFKTAASNLSFHCGSCPGRFPNTLLSFIPILQWLPKYNIRDDLLNDVIGGLTVGIMNVPQSMAYALLVGLEPIYGLYTSLYSALFYMLFTTSRLNSLGTSAVVSLMVGTAISSSYRLISHSKNFSDLLSNNSSSIVPDEKIGVSRLEIAVALTLCVGLMQLAMGILRLDFLMAYMSDEVVNGFTTAAAFYVLLSQMGKIFGIKAKKHEGFGELIWTTIDLVKKLPEANIATTVTSIITIVTLYICKNFVAVRVKKYFRFPIPFDFFVVIVGILLSHFLDMHEKWHMKLVGKIPTGLPQPAVPRLDIIPYVITQAPAIAGIVAAVSISMGKLFSKKHSHPFDVRQEFYATGITEFALSFFPSWTSSIALSRSLVNESAGTRTQLSTIFASTVLLLVIFLLGRFMSALPLCFLACIIIVALKGMFMQFAGLKRLWRISKFDFAIWMITFIGTMAYNIAPGLLIGVIFALLTVIWRAQRVDILELGCLNDTTGPVYYRPLEQYRDCRNIRNVVCLQIAGPIIFLNTERIRNTCLRAVRVRPKDLVKEGNNDKGKVHVIRVISTPLQKTLPYDDPAVGNETASRNAIATGEYTRSSDPVRQLIVDLSMVPYIDLMGANLLKEIWLSTKEHSITTSYTCPSRQIFALIKQCDFAEKLPLDSFYPSIEDALQSLHDSLK